MSCRLEKRIVWLVGVSFGCDCEGKGQLGEECVTCGFHAYIALLGDCPVLIIHPLRQRDAPTTLRHPRERAHTQAAAEVCERTRMRKPQPAPELPEDVAEVLHDALEGGDDAEALRLIELHLVDLEQADGARKGQRPLHLAARHGRIALLPTHYDLFLTLPDLCLLLLNLLAQLLAQTDLIKTL